MKRLLTIVIIIGIIAYILVQFLKDRRFNPPSPYDHPVSQKIDTDYYDPLLLKEYYKTVYEVGTYARALWRNNRIDVRLIDNEDPDEIKAAEYYNQLKATADLLQVKLEKSAELRAQGYTKFEVKAYFENGLTLEDLAFRKNAHMLGLKRGDSGAAVWEVQKLLNQEGDSIPEDGLFNQITTARLKQFQQDNNLYPSGEVDETTLKALIR